MSNTYALWAHCKSDEHKNDKHKGQAYASFGIITLDSHNDAINYLKQMPKQKGVCLICGHEAQYSTPEFKASVLDDTPLFPK